MHYFLFQNLIIKIPFSKLQTAKITKICRLRQIDINKVQTMFIKYKSFINSQKCNKFPRGTCFMGIILHK